MQYILDIIGSMIVGGIVLVSLLGLNGNIVQGAATQTFNLITQQNLTTLSDILENDLRKAGYHISDSVKITYIDTSEIRFKIDLKNDSTVTTVRYYLDTKSKSIQDNPKTKVLYRSINGGGATSMNLGVTRFRLWFSDAKGVAITTNTLAALSKIRVIKVLVNIESGYAYNSAYAGAYWERVIRPENLR